MDAGSWQSKSWGIAGIDFLLRFLWSYPTLLIYTWEFSPTSLVSNPLNPLTQPTNHLTQSPPTLNNFLKIDIPYIYPFQKKENDHIIQKKTTPKLARTNNASNNALLRQVVSSCLPWRRPNPCAAWAPVAPATHDACPPAAVEICRRLGWLRGGEDR